MSNQKRIKEMSATFQPGSEGIYFNVPAETYHAAPGFSHSMSKHMEPPARLKAYEDDERETTLPMIMGTLVHAALLEPDKPLPKLAVKPEDPNFLRTNVGKQWKIEQLKQGNIILKEEELRAVNGMVDSIKAHATCKRIFATGIGEVSIFERTSVMLNHATNETQEVLLKARMDWLPEGNALVDIKTVLGGGAELDEFQKILTQRRYWTQATWYLDRWNFHCMVRKDHQDLIKENFVFIAVEKVPPYLVNTFYIDEETLNLGRSQNARDIESFARCLKSGTWHGYSEDIKKIGLSKWEKNRLNQIEHDQWKLKVKEAQ